MPWLEPEITENFHKEGSGTGNRGPASVKLGGVIKILTPWSPGALVPCYARISVATFPATSVNRKSRPA